MKINDFRDWYKYRGRKIKIDFTDGEIYEGSVHSVASPGDSGVGSYTMDVIVSKPKLGYPYIEVIDREVARITVIDGKGPAVYKD